MLQDYLAVDNRYFYEQELAVMMRSKDYEREFMNAYQSPPGSRARTIVSFRGSHHQEHHLHFLNAHLRYLRDHDMSYETVSEKLLREAHRSELYDTYEVEFDSGRLRFHITEYLLVSGNRVLIVNPLQDIIVSNPIRSCRIDEAPLARVVDLSVVPRQPLHF